MLDWEACEHNLTYFCDPQQEKVPEDLLLCEPRSSAHSGETTLELLVRNLLHEFFISSGLSRLVVPNPLRKVQVLQLKNSHQFLPSFFRFHIKKDMH